MAGFTALLSQASAATIQSLDFCDPFSGSCELTAPLERVAYVESAIALTPPQRKSLSQVLTKRLNHSLHLVCRVNRDLIGGFTIKIEDWLLDASLAGKLAQLEQELLLQVSD